jgi:hypothetical protein
VFVVAIAELQGAIDAEATALAADLGCTAYDARLLLAPGLPAVVRTVPDRAQALDLLGRIRARGHGAIACDASAVVSSDAMVCMRRFRLRADAIALDDAPTEGLPYGDALALLLAVHRSRTDTATQSRERQFSVGRAVLTSGLSMTRTVKTETHTASEERENVLYVFRRSGATPWILREHGTAWTGHGKPLAPSEAGNFRVAVSALRERVPEATFDDRLLARRAPERTVVSGSMGTSTVRTSSNAATDLLAHLVALWVARSR